MEVVFDGELFVHYGFVYLSTESEQGDPGPLDLAFAGQRNGLCGAAVPHRLTMLTGTHTGDVPFRVEWHADAPLSQDSWEDVVEVSLDVQSAAVELSSFDDFREAAVRRTGPHRVRYSVVGMDAALEPADDDAPGARSLPGAALARDIGTGRDLARRHRTGAVLARELRWVARPERRRDRGCAQRRAGCRGC